MPLRRTITKKKAKAEKSRCEGFQIISFTVSFSYRTQKSCCKKLQALDEERGTQVCRKPGSGSGLKKGDEESEEPRDDE
jgi:hypothetical protein